MRELSLPFPTCFLLIAVLSCFLIACRWEKGKDYRTWEVYRGDDGSNAYSQLNQINKGNVKLLKVAWIHQTGDKSEYFSLECSPIIVDDILYGISPKLKTFALNAKTGKPLWVFDPFSKNSKGGGLSRGLTYWQSGKEKRIFMFVENKMIALDAASGKQIMDFGENSYVDLNKGVRAPVEYPENVGNTSPAVIYNDLIITGSAVGEDYGSSPGHIRAYDVRTGKMKWIFHTIPQPGEFVYDTWPKDSYK